MWKKASSSALALLTVLLSLTLLLTLRHVEQKLVQNKAALGADFIIVPAGYPSTTTRPIVSSEIQNNYLTTSNLLPNLKSLDNLQALSPQAYVFRTQDSCCSPEVKVYAFDAASDITLQALLVEGAWDNRAVTELTAADTVSGADELLGACLIGADQPQALGEKISLLGKSLKVVGKLLKSNNDNIDSGVFTDFLTARKLALATKRGEAHPLAAADSASVILLESKHLQPLKEVQKKIEAVLPENVYVLPTTNHLYEIKMQLTQIVKFVHVLSLLCIVLFICSLSLFFFLLKWQLANKGVNYASSEEKVGV